MKLLSTFAMAALVAIAGTSNLHANTMWMKIVADANQWLMPTGNYANHRYSELDQINTSSVGILKVAWTFSTGVLGGHGSAPLVIGNMMYVHTPFLDKVFALDLDDDASIVWEYEPKQDPDTISMCCDTDNRGIAYADGMIFLYQVDATLVALDAQTGKMRWSASNRNIDIGQTGISAPMVVKDKVYVGISAGEFGIRGHLTAYDTKTGKRVWRGYSMGPDSDTLMGPSTTHLGQSVGTDSGTATWQDEEWKMGGGATGGWFSYDPELSLVYYGTGSPNRWKSIQRPGDNRWSMTIFARDADTGQAKWVYQMTPWNQWDYDGVNEMILASIRVNGTARKTLVNFDRNGFAYILDRATGELLAVEKYDPAANWTSHVDTKTGRPQVVAKYASGEQGEDASITDICPAALISKDQQPASYSPMTALFYVPANHVCRDYEPFRVSYTAGRPYADAILKMSPTPSRDHMANFIAWDAGTGEIKWSIPERFSVRSGILSTAGGVVFYGNPEGYLKAVDAETGKELYKFETPSGIVGNIMTYAHKGKQYVAILSGLSGWAGIGRAAGLTEDYEGLGTVGGYRHLENDTRLGGVLTVFSL